MADHGKFTGEEGSWSGWDSGGSSTVQGNVGSAGEGTAESAWTTDPGHHLESDRGARRERDVVEEAAPMKAKMDKQGKQAKGPKLVVPVGSMAGKARGLMPAEASYARREARAAGYMTGKQEPARRFGLRSGQTGANLARRADAARAEAVSRIRKEPQPKAPTTASMHGKLATTYAGDGAGFAAGMKYEREHGQSQDSDIARARRVREHLAERPSYYTELARYLDPDVGGMAGKLKETRSMDEMNELLDGDDEGISYDGHHAAHARVDDVWREDPVRYNGKLLVVPANMLSPREALLQLDIDSGRVLHCGNCAAYTGGNKLTAKCRRIQKMSGKPGAKQDVHFFNTCGAHRPKGMGAPEAGQGPQPSRPRALVRSLDTSRILKVNALLKGGEYSGKGKRTGGPGNYRYAYARGNSGGGAAPEGDEPDGYPAPDGGGDAEIAAEGGGAIEAGTLTDEDIEGADAMSLYDHDPEDVRASGTDAVNDVRDADPEAATRAAAALGSTVGYLNGKKKDDAQSTGLNESFKAFLREFNQAAAPGSVLGPEFGGALARGDQREQPRAPARAQPEAEADTKPAEEGTESPEDAERKEAQKSLDPIEQLGYLAKALAGAAPLDRTPALPDYQEIYYQPRDDARKRLEEEQQATRRRAGAERNRAVYGFHGSPGTAPTLDPVLRYVGDPNAETAKRSVYGDTPLLGQRKPMVEAKDHEDRLTAGDTYQKMPEGQTDEGRVPRSPDERDDETVPDDYGGRPMPVDAREVTPSYDELEGEADAAGDFEEYEEIYEGEPDDEGSLPEDEQSRVAPSKDRP